MLPIYLTVDELRAITGRIKASAQVRWLRQNGFTVLRRADGVPLVSRAHFEAMMGGSELTSKTRLAVPNLSAF